ncbi:unnamed protein product, partial [Cladocopium goreaui]
MRMQALTFVLDPLKFPQKLQRYEGRQWLPLPQIHEIFPAEAEQIDDEIADLRRQEVEDLRQLQEELKSQAPSEEDLRVEALRRQQEQIARRVSLKKAKKHPRAQSPPTPPAPWRCYLDIDTGSWYYHNEVTNVTSWELPSVLMRDRPPAPPKPWQLVAHSSSGR